MEQTSWYFLMFEKYNEIRDVREFFTLYTLNIYNCQLLNKDGEIILLELYV